MMKKNPNYRKMVKNASKKAVNNLEKIFEKKWAENAGNIETEISDVLHRGSPRE